MPQNDALDVFTGGQPAGTLARSQVEEGDFLFGYAADCPPENAVSLTMPVMRDQYDSMNTVHPVFEMNLPEGALLEKLRLTFAKIVPDLDDLELLRIVGQSQIGRLRYAQPGAHPLEVPTENLKKLLTYKGTRELFSDLLEKYASHSGVSGVQPKVLVRTAEAAPPRLTHRGATHLVKSFDPREYPDLAANEFFGLRVASNSGIPTAKAMLSDDRHLLVVERFDLGPGGTYLGCEDFCVLNALRSHGRYDSSYERLARRIDQFVSTPQRQVAIEQFFLTLAVACAIENGDAHLKNFAVLYEHSQSTVRLAPAYDMVSTTPYQRHDTLALTISDSKEFPSREKLIRFALSDCKLGKAKIDALLKRVSTGVKKTIAEIRGFIGKHPDFSSAGEHLIATYTRGLNRSVLPG